MATPVSNSVPLPSVDGGNGTLADEFINGLAQGGSWQFGGGAHTLTYSLDLNFDGPTQDWSPDWTGAVASAFGAWSAVADVQFVPSGAPNAQAQNQSNADLALALAPGEGEGLLLALGFFPDPEYADVLLNSLGYFRFEGDFPVPRPEGDIIFDSLNSVFSNLGAGSSGYYVMMHEIGHALGLKHPDDDGGNGRPTFAALGIGGYDSSAFTVMQGQGFPMINPPATPMPADILAIQQIYGANLAYHAGDDTYALNTLQTQAIWDAGGIDTIDASNAGGAVTLDLRPGESSVAATGARTAIAFNVTIENATGGSGNDTLTGNSADNTLNGGAGNDTMIGGAGNDTYVRNAGGDVVTELAGQGNDLVQSSATYALGANLERLTLTGAGHINATGNGVNNVLTGNAGNNVLNGSGGNDTMIGGNGNDTYVRNAAGDVVTELAGQGNDLVQSVVTCALGANLERLTLTGAGHINGTGNGVNNVLTGNSGNNVLNGGNGNDTMTGGLGNDTFVRNAAGDVVTEAAGQGNDLVQSAVTYTLGANLERLTLTGTGNINGTGNVQNNAITGNAGNNVLGGGGGADILRGMDGHDTLIWNVQDTLFDGGMGDDALRVTSGNLNLTAIANTMIQNLERIDLTGGGNNALTLDAQDVLDLSTTTNTLKVLGDAGDSINIVPAFIDQGDSGGFHRYAFGGATLLVDPDITSVA